MKFHWHRFKSKATLTKLAIYAIYAPLSEWQATRVKCKQKFCASSTARLELMARDIAGRRKICISWGYYNDGNKYLLSIVASMFGGKISMKLFMNSHSARDVWKETGRKSGDIISKCNSFIHSFTHGNRWCASFSSKKYLRIFRVTLDWLRESIWSRVSSYLAVHNQ